MISYVICCYGEEAVAVPPPVQQGAIKTFNLASEKDELSAYIASRSDVSADEKFFVASRVHFQRVFMFLIHAGVSYAAIVKPEPLSRKIEIAGRPYRMREELLTTPSKPIDLAIARENLIRFNDILANHGLKPFLVFGTLLGATREKDFIPHDTDTDVGMLARDRPAFLPLVFELDAAGLELVRFSHDLMSFMRSGEYIDLYFFKKKRFPPWGWASGRLFIPRQHLPNLCVLEFHQRRFWAPQDVPGLLRFWYGANWATPIVGKHLGPTPTLRMRLVAFIPQEIRDSINRLLKRSRQ
jgi:lipopolysaccharide cholinephosphotransferase